MMHYQLSNAQRRALSMAGPGAQFDRAEMLCRTGDGHATGTEMWNAVDCPACKAARYQETAGGTCYSFETAPDVVRALENARANGWRVRLFYGDTETGEAWEEENDVSGTIGRSMGPKRIPLLIANARSHGGGAILDSCVVAIAVGPGRFIYKHPGFSVGDWKVIPSDRADYGAAVAHNGKLQSRHKSPEAAARYVAFMTGERMAK